MMTQLLRKNVMVIIYFFLVYSCDFYLIYLLSNTVFPLLVCLNMGAFIVKNITPEVICLLCLAEHRLYDLCYSYSALHVAS